MTDPQQLERTLLSFINARTWDESQRIVEQHPELLSEAADALLREVEAAQANAETVRILQENRGLLRCCREVGITRAFAEKLLTTEVLATAGRQGLTPEEFLIQVRAAERIAPEVREVLAELAAEGIEIRTQEDLEQALAARPDLRARLERDAQAALDEQDVPSEFVDDEGTAREAEQRFLRTGDRAALDRAAFAWSSILQHAAFSSTAERFRLRALYNAGGVLLRRSRACGQVDDFNRALDLLEQAVQSTPPDSPPPTDVPHQPGERLSRPTCARGARSGPR